MKEYKKTIIITTLITLAPIIIGLILWNRLPDTIATHWGADGEANGWSGKTFAVFGMPCILAAIHLFSICFTLNDPKKKNIHRKPLTLVFWLVPILSFVMNGITYMIALGSNINITVIVSILIGILFILLGNYLPKLKQNYTVGIKVPWTLNSEENWNRTHRLGAKCMIAGGFLILIGGFLGETAWLLIMLAVTLISTLIPVLYSFWLFRKGV